MNVKKLSKRILVTFLAFAMSFSSFVPMMGAIEAEAAESVKYTFKWGSSHDTPMFTGASGSIAGAKGICCDPGVRDPGNGTHSGKATKLKNTTKTAQAAYWLYSHNIHPLDTDKEYAGVREGLTCQVFISLAMGQDKIGGRSYSDQASRLKSTHSNTSHFNKRKSLYDNNVKSKTIKVPDNFEVYHISGSGQDGVVWKMIPVGAAKVVKKSKNATVAKLSAYKSFSGIEYTLYKSDKKTKVGVLKVGANGTSNTLSNLAVGTYYAKETKTNKAYKLDSSWKTVKITANKTTTLTVSDSYNTVPVKITKKSSGGEVIPKGINFTFKLVNTENSSFSYTLTVKGNGTANPSGTVNVAAGTYKVTEAKIPSGWQSVTKSPATVTAKLGSTANLTWTNKPSPGTATLKKSSTVPAVTTLDGYNDFTGIEYKLYKSDKKTVVGTFTVKKDGTANTITGLAPGTYYVKESKTNDYYKLNSNWIEGTVKSMGSVTFSGKDEPEYGSVKITKKEVDGDSMSDEDSFTFTLVNTKNDAIKYTLTVNGNNSDEATATLNNVPAGTYRVTETSLPDTYIDVTGGATVTVQPKQTAEVEYKNDLPTEAELYVQKTVDDNGSKSGFRFKVTGVLYNQGVITAKEILEAVNPTVEFTEQGYMLGDWTISDEIVEEINNAAKNGETDTFDVLLTNTATGGSYVETSDTTVSEDKTYYTKSGDDYSEAVANPSELGWYEKNGEEYVLSTDTTVGEKTYYSKDGEEYTEATVNPSELGWYEEKGDINIAISAKVYLKPVQYDAEKNAYVAEVSDKVEKTNEDSRYTAKYNDFNWLASATKYVDVNTGEDFTILTTRNNGNGYASEEASEFGIKNGVAPGRYTVEEIMTNEQLERYKEQQIQTKEILDEGSFVFKFKNEARWTPVKLKKISKDGKVAGLQFRITGRTKFGEEVNKPGVTDAEGNIDFGNLHAGTYVVEEVSFDEDKYLNNHKLTGYENPAIQFTVTGEEEEPIVIEFENKPKTELFITKVDGSNYEFLENAEFELYEGETKVAQFQIVTNDDGTAGVNLKMAKGDITATMQKTIFEPDALPEKEGPVVWGEDIDRDQVNLDTLNWARIQNLEEGKSYTLKEVKTPKGNYLASKPIEIENFESGMRIVVENYEPKIRTTATNKETNTHTANAGEITIVDRVEYKALIPGDSYVMKGTLVTKSDEGSEPVFDGGKEVTAEKAFTASETGAGFVELEFTFNASALAGQDVVAFEELFAPELKAEAIAEHKDIEDEKQTVHIPRVGTTADRTTIGDDHKVTDTVSLENLTKGETYTVKGVIMDKATGQPMDVEGNAAEKTFEATDSNMEVVLEFGFTNKDMLGKVGVVFEDLYQDTVLVGSHRDITDEKQTVEWPNPSYNMWKVRNSDAPKTKEGKYGFYWNDVVKYTTYIENTGNVELTMDVTDEFENPEYFSAPTVVAVGHAKVNSMSADKTVVNISVPAGEMATVTWEATVLEGAKEYLANDEQDSDSLNENGECNRVDKTNTPDDKDGWVNISSTKNVKYKDPKDPTGTMRDYPNGDKTDEAQTPVQKPSISTTAIGKDTATHITNTGKTTVVDIVKYKGLTKGRTYTMKGELKDKATKKTVATAEKTFTADGKDVELEFTFKTEGNKTYVAFEECWQDDILIAYHKDIDDEDQTVYVPKIGTTANLSKTTVKDKVEYKNLLVGKTYVMKGFLVNSKGEKLKGSDGSVKFKATKANGSVVVELPIKYDLGRLTGQSLVAFEELYIVDSKGTETLLTTHKDLNDKNQTVKITNSPSTGDHTNLIWFGGMGILAAMALTALIRRRVAR